MPKSLEPIGATYKDMLNHIISLAILKK